MIAVNEQEFDLTFGEGYMNDVDVELNKDVLTLKAEKNAESEDQSKTYLFRKRSYTAFRRTIFFPEEVDPSKVEGAMDMGILS